MQCFAQNFFYSITQKQNNLTLNIGVVLFLIIAKIKIQNRLSLYKQENVMYICALLQV